MQFKDIQDMAFIRLGMTTSEADATDLILIKNAINEGYMYLSVNVDKRVKTQSVTSVGGDIILPTDFYSLVGITHSTYGSLSSLDYVQSGNIITIKNSIIDTNVYNLKYINIPVTLVNDVDVLVLKDMFCYVLGAYATYIYMISKKKTDGANLLIGEFSQFIPIKSEGGDNSESRGND